MDRRKFLKFVGIGVASAAASKAISAPVAEALAPPKNDVGFVHVPAKFRYIESPPELVEDERAVLGTTYEIIIDEVDPNDLDFVYVVCDDKMYALRRGVKLTVPEAVVDVLRDETEERFQRVNGTVVSEMQLRYPFTIVARRG